MYDWSLIDKVYILCKDRGQSWRDPREQVVTFEQFWRSSVMHTYPESPKGSRSKKLQTLVHASRGIDRSFKCNMYRYTQYKRAMKQTTMLATRRREVIVRKHSFHVDILEPLTSSTWLRFNLYLYIRKFEKKIKESSKSHFQNLRR